MTNVKLTQKDKLPFHRKYRNPIKQKVLASLEAGVSMSLTRSVNKQKFIWRKLKREWAKIDRRQLYRIISEFKHERLISYQELSDGTIEVILTEAGHRRALRYNIDQLTIGKPRAWDKKWRVVMFDVPEKRRRGRDALRLKLKELGFFEWQKSVFVYPYPCRDQIDFVVEFFELRTNVRFAELINPTNEAELKLQFGLK